MSTSSSSRPDDGGGGPGGGLGGGDGGGDGRLGPTRRIIICAPLCFAAKKRGSIPPKELRAIMLGFYSSEQLTEAARLLLAEILRLKPDFNRKLPNRRNSKDNPESKARLEVDDLLSLIASADEASLFSNMPTYATADPDLIPSRQLLEGGFMAIMRQFAVMSDQYADIKLSLEHMGASSSYAAVFPPLEGDVQGCGGKDPVRHRVRHGAPKGSEGASDSESAMTLVRSRNTRKSSKRLRESESPPATSVPSAPLSYSAAVASAPAPLQPTRRPVLVGNSSTSTLKAAKHLDLPKKVFRIGNIDDSYSEQDIMDHLKSINVNCFTCFERSSDRSRLKQNKSFRVCILAADKTKLQSPEYWSAGITIAEWEFRPKKPESGEGLGVSPKGPRGPGGVLRGVDDDISRLLEEVRKGMGEGSVTCDGGSWAESSKCLQFEARNLELENEFIACKNNSNVNDNLAKYILSVEQVDNAIRKLKLGKAIGADRISAEHIVYAHPVIVTILTKLLNLLVLFEYVPNGFGIGVLIPIPKSEKDLDRTDNYRGITVNPVISKIFEHCLLALFNKHLSTSSRQFGFKPKTGCNKALYTVRKTIDYFIEREATVNVCALDMAKAFDKMNKNALFIKLLKNKCPITFINILNCWYDKSFACVKWGSASSTLVQMKSGTRQGGVCSPALFAVFVNDILIQLEKSGLGCIIDHYCLNSFMFADDLVLLTMTISDLNDMIAICKLELDWLDMRVNVLKSDCIRVGPRYNVTHCLVRIGNDTINWSTEIKYLGLFIVAGKHFACNLHSCKIKFFRALNAILSKIGDMNAVNVILSLVASNCTPILLYGLEAMHLNNAQNNRLLYAYNSVFYKLFRSFNANIIVQTQYYTGYLNLTSLIDLRTITFLNELCNYDASSPASHLFYLCGKNEWIDIASRYNINVNDAGRLCQNKIWAAFGAVIAALP